ncbi:MAG: hypothetical protein RJB61_1691 [Actinomycetota bacterium]|jgi:signal transduction histidine kinase
MPVPGGLLDQVVESLAGLGALDVATLRQDEGHEIAEISIGIDPMQRLRLLVAADLTTNGSGAVRAQGGAVADGLLGAVLAERERLARDLHDDVVQEVFATAMVLASLVPTLPVALRPRLEELIDRQDEIVRRLRSTVFALKGRAGAAQSMQHAVEQVCAEAQRALGFEPGLRIVGDLSVLDGDEIRDHLVMALRESLANVARHARASRVDAEIRVTPDQVKLIVEDDGRGIAANAVVAPGSVRALSASRPAVRSGGDGLGNLEQRARLLGGRCAVRNGVPRGTVVDWTVPLRLQSAPNGSAADGQHSGEASSDATSASLT